MNDEFRIINFFIIVMNFFIKLKKKKEVSKGLIDETIFYINSDKDFSLTSKSKSFNNICKHK